MLCIQPGTSRYIKGFGTIWRSVACNPCSSVANVPGRAHRGSPGIARKASVAETGGPNRTRRVPFGAMIEGSIAPGGSSSRTETRARTPARARQTPRIHPQTEETCRFLTSAGRAYGSARAVTSRLSAFTELAAASEVNEPL